MKERRKRMNGEQGNKDGKQVRGGEDSADSAER